GEGARLVARLQRRDGRRMCENGGLEKLLGLGQALDVIDVGMRGDQHLALAERKIHLPDELDDFLNRLLQADVDQQPVTAVKNQIDAAPENFPRLKVHLDYIRKNRLASEHEPVLRSGRTIKAGGLAAQLDCKD